MRKHIKLFYLERCPYCRQAFGFMDELKRLERYKDVEVELIEESREAAIANRYDYYYVPTFYVDGVKVHEGAATRDDVEAVFRQSMEV